MEGVETIGLSFDEQFECLALLNKELFAANNGLLEKVKQKLAKDEQTDILGRIDADDVLHSEVLRQLTGHVFISACSLLERNMDELALGVSARRTDIRLKLADIKRSTIERWESFFERLHGIEYLRPDLKAWLGYIFIVRNVFAHENGFVPDANALLAKLAKVTSKVSASSREAMLPTVSPSGQLVVKPIVAEAITSIAYRIFREASDKIQDRHFSENELLQKRIQRDTERFLAQFPIA